MGERQRPHHSPAAPRMEPLARSGEIDFDVNLAHGENRPAGAAFASVQAHDPGRFQLSEGPQEVLLGPAGHRGKLGDRVRSALGDHPQQHAIFRRQQLRAGFERNELHLLIRRFAALGALAPDLGLARIGLALAARDRQRELLEFPKGPGLLLDDAPRSCKIRSTSAQKSSSSRTGPR